jgi:hypothetical protein
MGAVALSETAAVMSRARGERYPRCRLRRRRNRRSLARVERLGPSRPWSRFAPVGGNVHHLSPEAQAYFPKKGCEVLLPVRPLAIHVFKRVACKEDRAFSRDLLSGRVPFDPESAPGSSARPPVHMHAHASQLHLARIASVLRSKSPLARGGAPTRICHREWLTGPFRRAHETHRERTGIVPT